MGLVISQPPATGSRGREWAPIFEPDQAKEELEGSSLAENVLSDDKLRTYTLQLVQHRAKLREQAMEAAEGDEKAFPELQARIGKFIKNIRRGYFPRSEERMQALQAAGYYQETSSNRRKTKS